MTFFKRCLTLEAFRIGMSLIVLGRCHMGILDVSVADVLATKCHRNVFVAETSSKKLKTFALETKKFIMCGICCVSTLALAVAKT